MPDVAVACRATLKVVTVLVHDVAVSGQGKGRKVVLKLKHLLLTQPLEASLDDLQSVDLPLHGPVAAGRRDVTELPYVGDMDLLGTGSDSNGNIQETPSGFVIRGLVS